jgi:formamidopyrimidine-DNA glycosylase
MPELPELDALAEGLWDAVGGAVVAHVDVAALNVLRTADPPFQELEGEEISGISRRGKYLILRAGDLHAVLHLARAGWVRVRNPAPETAARPGRGPLAVRLICADADGDTTALDVTEQGTKKSVALWITYLPEDLEQIMRLGPEADTVGEDEFAGICAAGSSRVKTVLTDQGLLAGVGNAWSDEILHRARLSPFAAADRLTSTQVETLFESMRAVLEDARTALSGIRPDRIRTAKKELLQVHGGTGRPCPRCGDTIAEVSYTDRSLQYCPTCQTGGKRLSDRRMDRLLK